MKLNLPIIEMLTDSRNILISGMGGGFDVLCGLPIYFELKALGLNVHLASLTHSSLKHLKGARRLSPTLIGVSKTIDSFTPYFPELHLARWFDLRLNEDVMIWCFEKSGVQPLIEHYQRLMAYLQIDSIILIDGGVDSLIRGDEMEVGSPAEDLCSIAAVSQLSNLKTRLTVCLGLGAELEIAYTHILENMSILASVDGFLGSCSLTRRMSAYQLYDEAVLYIQQQPRQDTSVINSSVVSAARGHYGDYHLTEKTKGNKLWISPLMPIYWFFDLMSVASHNLFMPAIVETKTFQDVQQVILNASQNISRRPHSPQTIT